MQWIEKLQAPIAWAVRNARQLFVLLCILLSAMTALSGCYYTQDEDAWAANNEAEVDSLDFRQSRHYWKGYNFSAIDSFSVASRPPFAPQLTFVADSVFLIEQRNAIIVEDIVKDTTQVPAVIWLKIAAVGNRQLANTGISGRPASGWIMEKDLMHKVVPDRPISKIIHTLGSTSFKWLLFGMAVALVLLMYYLVRVKGLRRRHTDSLYPTLLKLILSGSVVLHRSIWFFVPETWVEYYYYPALNPFNPTLPPIIAMFLLMTWTLFVVGIAVMEDTRRKVDTFGAFVGVGLMLLMECAIIFAVFAVVSPFVLLYPLMAWYWAYLMWKNFRHRSLFRYHCGNCGATIPHLGECPHCGAYNE